MRQEIKRNDRAELAKRLPERSKKLANLLTDNGRRLVVNHLPLAYAIAWRMRDGRACLDDLRQESLIGLCEAAMRYDESHQCTFATYAQYWCRKAIQRAIEKEIPYTQQNNEPTQDIADESPLRSAQQQRINHALQELTPTERQIIVLTYGIGRQKPLNISQTATAIGISKARTSELHLRALHKLQTALRKLPLADYLTHPLL